MNEEQRQNKEASRWSSRTARAARNRWLPEGRRGPMPWIIGIMMFLTLMSAAAGLALFHGLQQMRSDLAGGYTVQIVEANASTRANQVQRILALLKAEKGIKSVKAVPEDQLRAQLAPWIGTDTPPDELPIPALIDLEIATGIDMGDLTRRITAVAPSARIEAHGHYLGPVEQIMRVLMLFAGGVVALMVLVTSAVVMLAARSAYAMHRGTIDIMHHLGATDIQIARLFQRRMALDAIFGSILGLAAAAVLLWFLGSRLIAAEAELITIMVLPLPYAALLLILPLFGISLAMLTARITVRRALERNL